MISRHEAKKILNDIALKPETEKISVRESKNRVLAEDIQTGRPFPDTRRSAVDGYALIPGHNMYMIAGEVGAGNRNCPFIAGNDAVFVMTGATVPDGAEAVVRIENCDVDGDILNISEVTAGESINNIGEECSDDYLAAEKGTLIDKCLYPVLYYLGRPEIKVYKKPKIGVFVSGDEILEIEDEYIPGMAYNTNRYILESFLENLPVDYEFYGNVKDKKKSVETAFAEMSEKYDIVISSGGISMGKYDFVKAVFRDCGYEVLFERTKIKPGSPLMTAKKDGTVFIGMPGYPAAFTTNMMLYLLPFLRKSCGVADFENRPVNVTMKTSTRSREGRFDLNRAIIRIEDGEYCAYDPGSQLTSHYINFASVNGLLMLDEETGTLNEGDKAQAILF